jgi:hypothetical protein
MREAQPALFGAADWEQMDRNRQIETIQAAIESVGYDGTARRISICFRAAGEEVPA